MTLSAERGGRLCFALALGLLALLPSAFLLATALPILSEGGWLAHFAGTVLPGQAWTSARVAAEASLVALAAGALPGVLVARHEFRGRALVGVLSLLPLLLAPYVSAGTWLGLSSADFFASRHALALQLGLACAPYLFLVFFIATARMPRAYGELAAALGHGRWQRLWRVHLPAYAVPLAAGLLIVWAQVLGDYAAAERIGIETLSVGLHNLWFASQSSAVAAIVSCVLILPALAMVVLAAWAGTAIISQNPIPAAAAAAGRRPLRPALARGLLAWSLLCSLPGFWIPELATVRWAVQRWSRTRFADIPGDLLSSLLTAAATAALVAMICLATAMLLRAGAQRHWSSRLAERLPWLFLANYFLPSLVLALAFVMMSRDGSLGAELLGPARDSRLLVVLAAALRLMPFAMLPMLDALRRTPPALEEAARAFGAGPWRARWLAYAGHLWPALLLGCALVFAEALKELDLSLTLQPFGYHAASLKIYAFSRHQNMDRAAIWVLLTQALMLLPLGLLWLRARRLGTSSPLVEATPP